MRETGKANEFPALSQCFVLEYPFQCCRSIGTSSLSFSGSGLFLLKYLLCLDGNGPECVYRRQVPRSNCLPACKPPLTQAAGCPKHSHMPHSIRHVYVERPIFTLGTYFVLKRQEDHCLKNLSLTL